MIDWWFPTRGCFCWPNLMYNISTGNNQDSELDFWTALGKEMILPCAAWQKPQCRSVAQASGLSRFRFQSHLLLLQRLLNYWMDGNGIFMQIHMVLHMITYVCNVAYIYVYIYIYIHVYVDIHRLALSCVKSCTMQYHVHIILLFPWANLMNVRS